LPAVARAGAAAAPGGPIDWKPCVDQVLGRAGAVCGNLEVPLDRSAPNGRRISLALSMVRHSVPDSAYQGVMLVNPGGPGASGLRRSLTGASVPAGVGASYDWIGFDPRGVGASTPSLQCDTSYFKGPRPYYVPTDRTLEDAWLARSKQYAAACGRNGGDLLWHMRTTDTVEDMESIRQALGADKINYYGFSYGTYLGMVYATLHPDHVRRMVLDSLVDPRAVWYPAQLNQDVAFEGAIGEFFAWIAAWDKVYGLGKTADEVRARYYAEVEALRRDPVGQIGPDEFTDVVLRAGYRESRWPQVADAFVALAGSGDAGPSEQIYRETSDYGNDNSFAVYNAVQCTDVAWPKEYPTWREDAIRTAAKAPFNTWANLWYGTPCLYWPAAAGRPVAVDGTKAPQILLTVGTLDGATPFVGALEVRRRFPGARLISVPGQVTHAGSLSGDTCVDNLIADYLRSGALPARVAEDRPDVECQPLPRPLPSEYDPLGAAQSPAGSVLQPLLPPGG